MSYFYGYLTGNRGTATRCGSRSSGINAYIRSWSNDVRISLDEGLKGEDELNISIPKGLKVFVNGKVRRFR